MSYLLSVSTHEILWFSLRVEICATCTTLYLVVFMALPTTYCMTVRVAQRRRISAVSLALVQSYHRLRYRHSLPGSQRSALCYRPPSVSARFACNILNFCAYCTKNRSKYFESLCIFYAICGFLGLNHNMLWIST